MRTIYLSGGIDNLPSHDVHDWRNLAKNLLSAHYALIDPTDHPKNWPADLLVKTEIEELDRADVVLVRATKASWGTAMETFYAYRRGRHVVLFGVDDPINLPVWLGYHCNKAYRTLEEAVGYLINVYNGRH